jgi:hypothetical protein
MTIEMYMMLYLTALVFTVASFIWSDKLFIIILCFVLWESTAVMGMSITYVGFGSQNIITQTYSLGDPNLPIGTAYPAIGMGIMMLVYGFGTMWGQAHDDMNALFTGRRAKI